MASIRAVLAPALIGALIAVEALAQAPASLPPYAPDVGAVAIAHELRRELAAVPLPDVRSRSRSGFELRQQVALLSDELDHLATELARTTYAQLTPAQRAFFAETGTAIVAWQERSKPTVADVNRALARTHETIASAPAGRRAPRVDRVSPLYVAATEVMREIVLIEVAGAGLGAGTPSLSFGEWRCTPQAHRDTAIVFACPQQIIPRSESVRMSRARLTVYRRRTFLQAFLQRSPEPVDYQPVVIVLPSALGRYKVSAVASMSRLDDAQRTSQDFQHTNDFCDAPRDVEWTVKATPGWTVDVNSIDVQAVAPATGDTRAPRVLDRSASGFRLGATVRNAGSCETAADGTRTQDVRGSLNVRVGYREYRVVTVDTPTQLATGKLLWGHEVAVTLPAVQSRVIVEVAQFDGQRFVEETLPARRPWFAVEPDPERRRIVIRPGEAAAIVE